jgi:DNA-binding NarL/FixJ family response regulator
LRDTTNVAMLDDPALNTHHRIRILLVDDHRVLRGVLAELLDEQPGLEVVGQAGDGHSAVEMAMTIRPDVILMDVTMPGMSGVEATRRIVNQMPDVQVIGLSMHARDDMERAMREAGAVAYLTKSGSSDQLVETIHAVAD